MYVYNFVWVFVFSDDDIGRYYNGNGSNVYHLNNFDNLPRSYGQSIT